MAERCFAAPAIKGVNTLPVPFKYTYNPPWLVERVVYIKEQAWEIILKTIQEFDQEGKLLIESQSWSFDGLTIPYDKEILLKLITLLSQTIKYIEDLHEELYSKHHELEYKFSNVGYIKMIQSIQTVFKESLRLEVPYKAWGE